MATPSSPFPDSFSSDMHGGEKYPYRSDHSYDLNNRIMLTAIVSLSFVVLVVAALHIYARCALRGHAARRQALFARQGLAHSGEPPRTGLDPAVIASLPIFVYKQSSQDGSNIENNNPTECAVCLSLLEDQETARLLPNCNHIFHSECIDKWLNSRSTCPICRSEVEPHLLEPEPREGPVAGATVAPISESVDSTLACAECSSCESGIQSSAKVGGSRLSSFRRILSRERSSRRIQYDVQEDGFEDLERQ